MPHTQLTSLVAQLIRCYHKSIRHKPRATKTTFHLEYEKNMVTLAKDIIERKYRPWQVRFFIVLKPKPREIVAAHIRDRVVHHLIYERLSPLWEQKFSPHSFACRNGKGPLRANHQLARFLRRSSGLYVLKMDISNFFQSIDRRILREQLSKAPMDDETRTLVDVNLGFDPTRHCRRIGSGWDQLPPHKSLFHRPPGIGLPIGNLTSQFFANVYLNDMDHWLESHKAEFGIVFWQRYVDDILVLSKTPELLHPCVVAYHHQLEQTLALSLNPTKTQIQPVCRGIDHLGFVHKGTHLRIRNRVRNSLKRIVTDICDGPRTADQVALSQVNSYLGICQQAATFRFRKKWVTKLLAPNPHLTTDPDFRSVKLSQACRRKLLLEAIAKGDDRGS